MPEAPVAADVPARARAAERGRREPDGAGPPGRRRRAAAVPGGPPDRARPATSQSALRETREALAQPGDVTLFEPALRCGRPPRARRHPRAARRPLPDDRGEVVHQGEGLPRHRRRDPDVGRRAARASTSRASSSPTSTTVRLCGRRRLPRPLRVRRRHRRRRCRCRSRFRSGSTPRSATSPARCRTSPSARNAPIRSSASSSAFCAPEAPSIRSTCCPTARKLARQLRDDGYADLRDVPVDRLTRDDPPADLARHEQRRAELHPARGAKLAALPWPRYFVDFETVGPAVPMWPGTRPYQKIPMQWSCHRQDADGTLTQLPPFLDTYGDRSAPRVRRAASSPPSATTDRSSSTTRRSSAA